MLSYALYLWVLKYLPKTQTPVMCFSLVKPKLGIDPPMLLPLLSCLADFMDIDAIGNEAFMS